MSIILVEQTQSAPINDNSWERLYETDKFYNLGINNPVDYNFDSDTVKKGVLITIGGSNYETTADTDITGTASDYVKIDMSTLLPSYVTDLTGVTWNDTYNYYADATGNAYIFNEPKAVYSGTVTSPKTLLGKFAENAYVKVLNVAGIATLEGAVIVGGTSTGAETPRNAVTFNLSGFGVPGAWNTNSNGDKFNIWSNGINTDTRIGMSLTDGLWIKAMGTTSENAFAVHGALANTGSPDRLFTIAKTGNITASGDITVSGETIVLGSTGQDTVSTARRLLSINAGGYAEPSAFNTDSNGDKIKLFSSTNAGFDARIGVGTSANMWFKASGDEEAEGAFYWYTGSNPTLRATLDSTKFEVAPALVVQSSITSSSLVTGAISCTTVNTGYGDNKVVPEDIYYGNVIVGATSYTLYSCEIKQTVHMACLGTATIYLPATGTYAYQYVTEGGEVFSFASASGGSSVKTLTDTLIITYKRLT